MKREGTVGRVGTDCHKEIEDIKQISSQEIASQEKFTIKMTVSIEHSNIKTNSTADIELKQNSRVKQKDMG